MNDREELQKHRDAGTCFICGKPVLDGQPRHGATGAHWACTEDTQDKAKVLSSEVAALLDRVL